MQSDYSKNLTYIRMKWFTAIVIIKKMKRTIFTCFSSTFTLYTAEYKTVFTHHNISLSMICTSSKGWIAAASIFLWTERCLGFIMVSIAAILTRSGEIRWWSFSHFAVFKKDTKIAVTNLYWSSLFVLSRKTRYSNICICQCFYTTYYSCASLASI